MQRLPPVGFLPLGCPHFAPSEISWTFPSHHHLSWLHPLTSVEDGFFGFARRREKET